MLSVGRHEASAPADDRSPLLIRPLALVDLLGLTPIPVPEPDDDPARLAERFTFDGDRNAWMVETPGAGGAMLALAQDGRSVPPRWTDKTLDCQMHGTVVLDGLIYGTAQSAKKGLVCLDWATGGVKWNVPEIEQGVVIAADGMLYVYAANGGMYLVKPSGERFQPVGKFAVTRGTEEHWAHPTIANGRLYIRHGDAMMAYNIKSGS